MTDAPTTATNAARAIVHRDGCTGSPPIRTKPGKRGDVRLLCQGCYGFGFATADGQPITPPKQRRAPQPYRPARERRHQSSAATEWPAQHPTRTTPTPTPAQPVQHRERARADVVMPDPRYALDCYHCGRSMPTHSARPRVPMCRDCQHGRDMARRAAKARAKR